MKPYEIEQVLKTITLLVDTREQKTEQLYKRIEGTHFPFAREKLDFGDYSVKYTDLNGVEHNLKSEIAIERKMSLDEICGNLTKGRDRFEREFERAKKAGCKMHLLIENGSYEKIIKGTYRSRLNSNSLFSSIIAFCDRYDLTIHFCKSETTPILMYKLFYHHVRNILNNEINRSD